MDELTTFLRSQKILQIAPHAGDPWIANVYLAADSAEKIYFVGSTARLYGQQLLEDPKLAFATAWSDENNDENRKGIQGVGTCEVIKEMSEIETAIAIYRAKYPKADSVITAEWARNNESGACVWCITPSYIKFWSDSDYGPEGSKEFNF